MNTNFQMTRTGFYLPSMKPVPIYTDDMSRFRRFFTAFKSRHWQIDEPGNYTIYVPFLETSLMIPHLFIFDGASIPRPLWPFMAPTGILFIPGLFHDFGFKYGCFLNEKKEIIFAGESRKFFDKVFRDMSTWINDVYLAEAISYRAVRLGAWPVWNKYRRNISPEDVYKDFPGLGMVV